jgi:2-succinyl-5-enolpyruvyl-6-hydroxy-3-cyclohexene-1-carboxylate synthase
MPDGPDSESATSSPATDYALALLSAFVRLGVRHIVLSPGSRSQALALVAAELERQGLVRLHVRIDERVAAFVALGIGVETGVPALVITTSGTATANLHPAVLEAHHSGVPMILLTADRPAELRGIRSNQTTVQPGMYGDAVRLTIDVPAPVGGEADAAGRLASDARDSALGTTSADPGPVHLNLAFRDPLSAPVDAAAVAAAALVPQPLGAAPLGPSPLGPAPLAPSPLGPAPLASSRKEEGSSKAGCSGQNDRFSGNSPVLEPTPFGREAITLEPGPRTVVIAGHGAGPAAEELARGCGWPLIAEVSSGSHFGPNLVVAYRELLAIPEFADSIERAVVFGHPTLSREVPALLTSPGVETVVVAPTGAEAYNPGRRARVVAAVSAVDAATTDAATDLTRAEASAAGPGPTDPAPTDAVPANAAPTNAATNAAATAPATDAATSVNATEARRWLRSWVMASRRLLDEQASTAAEHAAPDVRAGRSHEPADRLAFAKAELAAVRAPLTRRSIAEAVWRFTWPHDRLVVGASRIIRDLDRAAPGKRITVHANRGLAGIDGTVSTAIGIALALGDEAQSERPAGTTRVLLGDLTLLHDVGALAFGIGEEHPALQIVVGNDGGGTIFDSLEVARSAPAEAMDRVMLTPQNVDLETLATAYGWRYVRATTHGELDQALSAPAETPTIIEVPLPRE